MSCPKHLEVSAYIDDMLPPDERRQFMTHLQQCPVCQARMAALHALQSDLRAMPSPVLGFDLAARLEERMRAGAVRRTPAKRPWFDWSAAGVTVAVSLASGVWLGGLLIGGGAVAVPSAGAARVFDPVPPGGLCAAAELCRLSKGMP
ncbi:MAG TPA: zf-HC2 domain-containing protein [Noviherbaspirillum sp.]